MADQQGSSSASSSSSSSPGASKTDKDGSSDKTDKRTQDVKVTFSSQLESPLDKPRTPRSPVVMPKSILRVSSPDGHRRPRQFVNPETGEPLSPELAPSSPNASPMTPLNRPTSPAVRFAKATIHHVEVGPGRRFLPVRRKSKSTVTYIGPHDPGAQPAVPKTLLQSPTKMRRHQENQAAMGRYWLQTEEEERQWRMEAERLAQEEQERYRNEPASPLPLAAILTTATAGPESESEEVRGVQNDLAAKIMKIGQHPSSHGDEPLDRLEEVESEDEDDETDGRATPERALATEGDDGTWTEASKGPEASTASSDTQSKAPPSQNGAGESNVAAAHTGPEAELEETKPAGHKPPATPLAEKQVAEEHAAEAPAPPAPAGTESKPYSTQKSSCSSSDSALGKAKDKRRDSKDATTASSSGRPNGASTTQQATATATTTTATTTTATTTTTTPFKTSSLSSSRHRMGDRDRTGRDKEKAKEKLRASSSVVTTAKSTPNLRASYFLFSGTSKVSVDRSSSSSCVPASLSTTTTAATTSSATSTNATSSAVTSAVSMSKSALPGPASSTSSSSSSSSSSAASHHHRSPNGGSGYHLRRTRRFFEEHAKHVITA
ncbi:hypothetical protein VTJ83DRAFT_3611 [Remersonia thermophila]|uniref:Uncharacterized protein n=1 Tax=Remersonia thermophila TaxID=72144 RepID=A0ABR4DEN8_9PEZI